MSFTTNTRCTNCKKLSTSVFETVEHDNGYIEILDREWRCSCGHLNNFKYRTSIVPYHPLDDVRNGRGMPEEYDDGTSGISSKENNTEPAEGGRRAANTVADGIIDKMESAFSNHETEQMAAEIGEILRDAHSSKKIPRQDRLDAMKADSPGGDHYRKGGAVQPIDLIESFDLPYREGSIIDHVARWRTHEQGLLNLKKALWMLQRIIISNE